MAGAPFKMVSMRRPKESLSVKKPGKITGDEYSYEHRITLNQDNLDKLGLDPSDLSPGDKFHVMGHGEVTHVSQDNDAEGGKSGRVELQMKKLGLRQKGAANLNGGMKAALDSGISEAQSDG